MTSLIDEDNSNPFCDVGVEALRGVVWEQRFDCLEQTMVYLAQLMGNVDMDREEKRNLSGDLYRGRPNPRPIPEFDEIPFYDGRFLKKRFIKWLAELESYFYFNKVTCHKKVGLVHNFLVVLKNGGLNL